MTHSHTYTLSPSSGDGGAREGSGRRPFSRASRVLPRPLSLTNMARIEADTSADLRSDVLAKLTKDDKVGTHVATSSVR